MAPVPSRSDLSLRSYGRSKKKHCFLPYLPRPQTRESVKGDRSEVKKRGKSKDRNTAKQRARVISTSPSSAACASAARTPCAALIKFGCSSTQLQHASMTSTEMHVLTEGGLEKASYWACFSTDLMLNLYAFFLYFNFLV